MKLQWTLGLMLATSMTYAAGDSLSFSCFGEQDGKQINIAGTLNHSGDVTDRKRGAAFNKIMMKRDGLSESLESACTIQEMHIVPMDGRVEAFVDCGNKIYISGMGFSKNMQEVEGVYGGSQMAIRGTLAKQELNLAHLTCEGYYSQGRPKPQTLTSASRTEIYDVNQER